MKRYLIVFIISSVIIPVYCQDNGNSIFQKKNSIQADLGGHGLFYSINYERIILNGKKFKITSQIGISYYPAKTGIRDFWMPIGLNELLSFKKHHIEAGFGFIVIREATRDLENNPDDWFWSGIVSGRIGYRYQKPDGRIILRIGFTPFLEVDTDRYGDKFHPSGGLSVGYCF